MCFPLTQASSFSSFSFSSSSNYAPPRLLRLVPLLHLPRLGVRLRPRPDAPLLTARPPAFGRRPGRHQMDATGVRHQMDTTMKAFLRTLYTTYFAPPTAQDVYDRQRRADAIRLAQDKADLLALRESELLRAQFAAFNLQMRVEEHQARLEEEKARLQVALTRLARLAAVPAGETK